MKEWIRCLLWIMAMTVAYLLIRLLLKGTLQPWDDTLVFAFCGCLQGIGIYYGDRMRRKNKAYKDKINEYLNKDNYGF